MPTFFNPPHLCGVLLAAACLSAHGAPDYACVQVGEVKAAPPLIPEAIRIHECSSFSGGAEAANVGKLWCDHASKATLGPNDTPPKVTRVEACPSGAVALCSTPMPNSQVKVSRYHYVADRGAGGIDGLRKICEGRKRKDPTAVFTTF
jgi:hypothetical protein